MTDIGASLRAALRLVHWQPSDLWVEAAAIGGRFRQIDIDDITSGDRAPTRAEYNVLAATLNEHFTELGVDRAIPSWEELG